MADREIKCGEAGCEQVRIFTEGEQKFFKEKGFNDPKFCHDHSKARRAARDIRENSPFKPAFDAMREDPHTRHGRRADKEDYN